MVAVTTAFIYRWCSRTTHLNKVALLTYHGRYVTAMDGNDNWRLRQEPDLSECGWFTLQHLDRGKVAFETCADRYVTVMNSEQGRQWVIIAQAFKLDHWEMFVLQQ